MTESKDAFSTSFRMAGIEGFYSTLVATCSFNAFLLFTAMISNIMTTSPKKNIIFSKAFKNIAPESRCF